MKNVRLATVAVVTAMVLSNAFAAPKDGVYTQRVMGHNALFDVVVTIEGGKITKIETPNQLESPGVGSVAIQKLTRTIIDNQSVDVDGVTGATLTSFAIKGAVADALEAAGADEEAFSKPVKATPAITQDVQTEVVIVGGGGSGLAAAVSALENGAKVVIIEKMGYLGGSTNVCGGAFNASDTSYQKALKIEDNPQKLFEQTMKGGHNTNDPAMVHYLADHAKETLQWLENMGLKVNPKVGAATRALYLTNAFGSVPSKCGFP